MAERLNPGVAAAPPMQRMGAGGGAMPTDPGPGFGAARGMSEPGYSNSPLHMPAQVRPLLRLFVWHLCARQARCSLPAVYPCPLVALSSAEENVRPCCRCACPSCITLPRAARYPAGQQRLCLSRIGAVRQQGTCNGPCRTAATSSAAAVGTGRPGAPPRRAHPTSSRSRRASRHRRHGTPVQVVNTSNSMATDVSLLYA